MAACCTGTITHGAREKSAGFHFRLEDAVPLNSLAVRSPQWPEFDKFAECTYKSGERLPLVTEYNPQA